jgi:hypothetical protein
MAHRFARRLGILVAALIAASALAAAPTAGATVGWLPPAPLVFPSGADPAAGRVLADGVTATGDTLVLYGDLRFAGHSGAVFNHLLLASKAPGASSFGPPTLLGEQVGSGVVTLGVAPDGSAAIVWAETTDLFSTGTIKGVIRRPDGSLSPVATLASYEGDPDFARRFDLGTPVANPSGTFAVGLEAGEGGEREHALVAVGTPADGFAPAHDLGAGTDRIHTDRIRPDVVVDDAGDVTATWLERYEYQGGPYEGPQLAYAARMHDGALGDTQTLAGPAQSGDGLLLAADPAGDAVIARAADDGVRAYTSPSGSDAFDDGQAFPTVPFPQLAADAVDPGGSAVVGWVERPDGLDHAVLRTVARADAGSSFGAAADKLSLPRDATPMDTIGNRRGDVQAVLSQAPAPYDDNSDVLVWRTGPDAFASQVMPMGRYFLIGARVNLDEQGNALVSLVHYGGPNDAPYSSTVAWRATGAPAFSLLPLPSGTQFAFGSLNRGSMVATGTTPEPAPWASVGDATAGFGSPELDLAPTPSGAGPAAVRNQDDAVVFAATSSGPVAIVRGPLPEPPAPEPSETTTGGGGNGGGQEAGTPTQPATTEIAGTTTGQTVLAERPRSAHVAVV